MSLNLSREMREQSRITWLEVTNCKKKEGEVSHQEHVTHRRSAARLVQHLKTVVAVNLKLGTLRSYSLITLESYLGIIIRVIALKQWIMMLWWRGQSTTLWKWCGCSFWVTPASEAFRTNRRLSHMSHTLTCTSNNRSFSSNSVLLIYLMIKWINALISKRN